MVNTHVTAARLLVARNTVAAKLWRIQATLLKRRMSARLSIQAAVVALLVFLRCVVVLVACVSGL